VAESPKQFLREVKAGIGDPVLADGTEKITFQDEKGNVGELMTGVGSDTLILGVPGTCLALSPGMAKRLANSLERWAIAGNLGNGS
jgi:hypothetical protein